MINKETIDNLLVHLSQFTENSGEDELSELRKICNLVHDLGGSKFLTTYFGDTTPLDLHLMDYLLGATDVEKINFLYSSGILRYTANYQEQLPNWYKLRTDIYDKALKEGVDPVEVLYGMMD